MSKRVREERTKATPVARSQAQGPEGASRQVGPGVAPLISGALQSGASPLGGQTRSRMEGQFGHDFSQVRVHTDTRADESARAVQARAFTVGTDIVFRAGEYNPASTDGQRLLAHELTHVVQQDGASGGRGDEAEMTVSQPGDPAELEAEAVAGGVMEGQDLQPVGKSVHRQVLQREEEEEEEE